MLTIGVVPRTAENLSQNGGVREENHHERQAVHHDHAKCGVCDFMPLRWESVECNALLIPGVLRVTLHVEDYYLKQK
jgi:hypothetical protein